MKREKRLEKAIDSLEEQKRLHEGKKKVAEELGQEDLVRYYDKEIKAVKVYVDHHRDINHIRKKLRDSDLAETDIRYIKRYLTEKRIDPLVLSEAEGEIIEDTDEGISIQGEVKQKSSEFLKNPRILAFDIEVYGDFSGYQKYKQDPIIMIAFKGEDFRKVITWKKFESKDYVEFVKDEQELIWKFIEVIKKYDDYNEDYFRNKEKNFSRYLKELEESGNYLEGYFTKMKELDLFENSIMDALQGITHRLRTKEFELRAELQNTLQKLMGFKQTIIIEQARFNLEGVEASKRKIRERIATKELVGWDDPRLSTLSALKRRGFLPRP